MDSLLDYSQRPVPPYTPTHPLPTPPDDLPHLSPSPISAARATSSAGSQGDGGVSDEDHNILEMDGEPSEDDAELEWGIDDEDDEMGVDDSYLLSFGSDDGLPELSFSSPSASSSPGLGPTTPRDFDLPPRLSLAHQQPGPLDFERELDDSFPRYSVASPRGDGDPFARRSPSPPFLQSSLHKTAFPSVDEVSSALQLQSSSKGRSEGALHSSPSAFGVDNAPPARAQSPTQAEMDAFFGFVSPLAPAAAADALPRPRAHKEPSPELTNGDASPPLSPGAVQTASTHRESQPTPAQSQPQSQPQSQSQSQSQKRPRAPRAQKGVKPVEREYYQLQPIPAVSPETGEALTPEEKRVAIIASLQRLALSILSQITDNVVPSASSDPSQGQVSSRYQPIKVKLVRRSRNDGEDGATSKQQTIVFPRKCGQGEDIRLSGRELAALLKVIELIIDGLHKKLVSTKRDLYYRDIAVFGKQQTVDALIEDIAATLQVRRSDLNVVAAAKGLFAGSIKIVTTDGQTLESKSQGVLIPAGQAIEDVEKNDVKWVLVVEKEAVFQTLCTSSFFSDSSVGNGVLLTGKGYPDLATRELLKRLAEEDPSVPLLALVDSDPHGLDILSTYRFGSASLAFDAANLTVDSLEWLGVKGSEWDALGIDRDELLSLTKADRTKAAAMLRREWLPDEWRRELEYMLHLGRKAEIQILSSSSSPSTESQQPSQGGTSSSDSSSRLVEYVKSKIRAAIASSAAKEGDNGSIAQEEL
ncbi:hypothetical protein JCM6882_004290 [Rhodosporidiobolus microsporus]